ncbi:discoidin, CUB and LCCL domain-containing protein 2 isoform X2 [Heterocephalus glaber]|uniref:Discoidin, CUB and LCCL domain-containing protein 2 isoform X2 n=1 Tax=Heterocephalus glaber TaxID=10181 RepID=A0AAX6RCF0_HETGA|nr:discoidin, CUB and LCCL domain-containing protein 2 isoform X2 [Heterocephalus glaber]
MASWAVLRARRSSQCPRVRAAVAAPALAALPFSRSLPPGSNSSSMPLFLLLLLILLLLLEDAGAQQGDGCGHTVLGPESGTFASINYPKTCPNSTVCKWEIRVKMGERIRIKLGDVDIQDTDSCHFSYLKIYNGIGLSRTEIDLITCLDTVSNFLEPEFSKYCPPGCLLPFAEISGTVPHGYRDSSPLCVAGIHAGVVSDVLGGQISVVISKGIPYYESSLANNVTSVVGHLSTSLFTFKTSGCYGTLGMESGVIADPQITASSVLEWTDHTGQKNSWKPEKSRLKKPGPPWASLATDKNQWLQIDLNKEKKITGIITTGSTMVEHNYYVSAYRIQYSDDGRNWTAYSERRTEPYKIFQGNKDYHQDVRNNFLPPIIARFIRVIPMQWQQKIAMKVELLGCQFIPKGRPPKPTQPPPPQKNSDRKNTTVPPKVAKDVALAAVLVPVLVMVLTTLILILVCAWHWRNRKKKTEGTYDLPTWDRAGWWKGMKQFLPAKSVEHEETPVRYSSSEVNHLNPREVTTMLQTDSAEYAQPLVGGIVGTLHQRSTFKPEEGKEAGYADLDLYNSPVQEVYHAYAEPLPITGPEYATPIVMDMSGHPTASVGLPSTSTFKATGNQHPPLVGTYNTLLSRTDSCSSAQAQYDTPKGGKPAAPEELVYQVPQSTQEVSEARGDGEYDVFKEIL